MRYGIISDIHGNLEALEGALSALSHEKIDRFMCVGDIVGYGANPRECIEKAKALGAIMVRGNHDAACTGATDIRDFNEAAREAVIWTRNNLDKKDIAFLESLELLYKDDKFTLVHGTLEEPGEFHYMLDKNSAQKTFALLDTQICFVGHSHIPGIFSYKNNTITYSHKEKMTLSKDERLIINVGSIGQPRDGNPKLCYSVYDTKKNRVELKRLPYNVRKAQDKILKAGLPSFLAYRLSEGA